MVYQGLLRGIPGCLFVGFGGMLELHSSVSTYSRYLPTYVSRDNGGGCM